MRDWLIHLLGGVTQAQAQTLMHAAANFAVAIVRHEQAQRLASISAELTEISADLGKAGAHGDTPQIH